MPRAPKTKSYGTLCGGGGVGSGFFYVLSAANAAPDNKSATAKLAALMGSVRVRIAVIASFLVIKPPLSR